MKRLLILILMTSPVVAQAPDNGVTFTKTLTIGSPIVILRGKGLIEIRSNDNKQMALIGNDGKITYGEGYKPDAAAKDFWNALAATYPQVCEKIKRP